MNESGCGGGGETASKDVELGWKVVLTGGWALVYLNVGQGPVSDLDGGGKPIWVT